MLFPALGVSNLYPFRYSFVADHIQYLASIPFIASVCAVLVILARRVRVAEPALIVVLALPLGLLPWRQAHDCRDGDTMYRATLARNPECWLCYNNLGSTRLHGSTAELNEAIDAIERYAAAARLEPDLPSSHQGLAAMLAAAGRTDEAVAELRTFVRLQPASATAHYQLALLLATNHRLPDAIPEFKAAVDCEPSSAHLHHDFGAALANAGRLDDAVVEFNETLRLQPNTLAYARHWRRLRGSGGANRCSCR